MDMVSFRHKSQKIEQGGFKRKKKKPGGVGEKG